MGRPKALVDGWLQHAIDSLAGCDQVIVVLGAQADRARARIADHRVQVVVAQDWDSGMGASLRAGLGAIPSALPEATRCLLTLVDLPDVGSDVIQRVLAEPDSTDVLARASYGAVPGHPVLMGRGHWAGAMAGANGDQGARDYLRAHAVTLVECGDLATGRDVDRPDGVPEPTPHQPTDG